MAWWYNDSSRYGTVFDLGKHVKNHVSANYDIRESETSLTLEIDIPGAKSADLKVETESNLVKIQGKKKGRQFFYDYVLGKSYDPTTGVAKLEDGVLTITFNKHEMSKPRVHSIQVK